MDKQENIELRSEEFREILGTPPKWIIQYGTLLTILGFAIITLFSYFFRYPDIVKSTIIISTIDPPVPVLAKEYGYLKEIIKEKSFVQEGEPLAILDDDGDINQIIELGNTVDELIEYDRAYIDFEPKEDLNLGPLQADYLTFTQLHKQFKFTRISSFEHKAITQADINIKDIDDGISYLEELKQELEEKINHEKSKIASDSSKAIILKYQKQKKEYELKQSELRRESREIQSKKMSIREGWKDEENSKSEKLKLSLIQLSESIDKWKANHIIKSPIAGTVYYTDLLKSGEQFAKKDHRIFVIVPPNAEENIIGKLYIPTIESGKIKEEQVVKIRFPSYDVRTFGLLEGSILNKAEIPNTDDNVFIQVAIPKDMISTAGKKIEFKHDMQGEAHIVTEDRPLLFRFFDYFTNN